MEQGFYPFLSTLLDTFGRRLDPSSPVPQSADLRPREYPICGHPSANPSFPHRPSHQTTKHLCGVPVPPPGTRKATSPTARRWRLRILGKKHGLQGARIAKNARDEEKEGWLLAYGWSVVTNNPKRWHTPLPCRLTVHERDTGQAIFHYGFSFPMIIPGALLGFSLQLGMTIKPLPRLWASEMRWKIGKPPVYTGPGIG